MRPTTTGTAPAASNASSVRSKATALISTPAPNPITRPMALGGVRTVSPTTAPTISANPPTKPQNAASHMVPEARRRRRRHRGPASVAEQPVVDSCVELLRLLAPDAVLSALDPRQGDV